MKYLVTGGAGFIGSTLVDALIARGDDVGVLDNLSTGHRAHIPSRVTFIEGDIRDPDALQRAIAGVDIVFHLAACVSVPLSVERPQECNAINVEGTLRLLRQAARAHAKRVVFASSTAIYGEAPPPIREDSPCAPLSPYGASKLAGEHLCAMAAQHFGIETVCLRFFNVYGPRQDPHSAYAAVIPKFITGLLGQHPLVIFGDGQQTRDFVFVRDVVGALLCATHTAHVSGKSYNIATGRAVSILELAAAIGRELGCAPKITFAPARTADILHSYADVSAAEHELGFRAPTPLDRGLRETVSSFRG